jgi:hypothetical protein
MDCSSEEYGEEEAAGKFPDGYNNGLGFFGGPAWDYPEEEIAFSPSNEVEGNQHDAIEENDDIESCSGASMDHIRMAMIENYIATHDIHDDDHDLLHDVCNINIDYAVSQPSPITPIMEQDVEIINGTNIIDDGNRYNASAYNSSNNNVLPPQTSPLLAPKNKRPTWISNSSTTSSKRRRREKVRNSSDARKNNGQQLHTFREAALCVPYEYTTKLATFYIRRPYGVATVPEIFRVLSPHTTDKEYKKRSRVSSSETIQVAIVVSADNSLMLLYGSAGVRYKTDPSDILCDDWVDVPDVGIMDVPLGYVNNENHSTGNQNNIEYSLDEMLEEAMLVREQYCSTILSAALEIEQHRSLATAKSQSPPSLAKSIVSTPPRNIYYYDGSSNNAKLVEEEEEQQEEITGRKLDFYNMSPSLTRGSNETTSTHRHSSRQQQQRKRRRRRLYQFCQRLIIVVGFYICGIFLVANLSVVDYHRPSTVDPGLKTAFANNLLSWMFLNAAEEQQQQIKGVNEDEKLTKGDDSLHLFQIAEHFAANTTNEFIESDCSASIEGVSDERNIYKRELEATQTLLREQVEQNNDLSNKYHSERTKTEELQKGKEDAEVLVNNLIHETETLVMDLEIEQGQRRKLEEKMRELEIQIMTMKKEKSQMNHATASCTFNTSVEMVKGFEIPVLEGQINTKEYQVQQQLPSRKEIPEAILVEFFDVTKPVGENRSLQEEEDSTDEIQLVAVDELLSALPKNEMQSIESFILKNARANKGPIIPKVFRQITKQFEAHGSRRDASESHNKVEVFTSSVKDAIAHKFQKIARGRRHVGNDDLDKQSTESSDMLRRQVKKNVAEVSKAGIRKLDRGQDAINVIGGFAKTKLKSVGKRVGGFATKKWRERRLQGT